ncbi:restriction endonuclease [Candidatus Harpocratesius sp.]
MTDPSLSITELKKKLIIVEEYDPPKIFPLTYITAQELRECSNISLNLDVLPSDLLRVKEVKSFIPQDLICTKEGFYIFRPTSMQYPSLFECIQDLAKNYSYSNIFSSISWQEFEKYLVELLESIGYQAFRSFRFSANNRKYEIDCVALKNNHILFIDGKKWKNSTISPLKLKNALQNQFERVKVLSSIPMILSNLLSKFHLQIKITYRNKKQNSNVNSYKLLNLYSIILVSNKISEVIINNEGVILDYSLLDDFIRNFDEYQQILHPISISI